MSGKVLKKKSAALRREDRVTFALVHLDVDLKKLEREPKFTEMLRHHSLGGLEQVLMAMRLASNDPIIAKFLERYDRISPAFQKLLPWEAVAQLAEIECRQLLGAIVLALREHSATEVKIAALTAHPTVTQATIKSAQLLGNDGVRDRQMIHQALGFLAVPKGQTINLNFPEPEADASREIDPDDIDMNELFPDLTETQKLLSD
jgi:hypothetical protein